MNRKKLIAIILCVVLSTGISGTAVYAQSDTGKIDLYETFSSKEDKAKTEVGSRIYKWSMHLPDDGVIYKSERANFFNMSTASYQSSIQLEVNKNKEEITLEELLYKMQNRPSGPFFGFNEDKEYVVDIATDEVGAKYIRIIKSNQMYDYFMVNEAAKEFSDYIENRIYIQNNYIYNLTINMKGEFYRQHEEMFDKLVSSFKLSFDDKNSFIKELSDSVSSTRECKNASYGWKLIMSPYWRVEGAPNARTQTFSPVYSDEELDMGVKKDEKKMEEEFNVPEGVTVSLVSSASKEETAASWAQKEVEILKNNYHNDVYEILSDTSSTQNGINVHHIVTLYKTMTKNPYVVHNVYVVGNGYKYLVSATMKEEKYKDVGKRNEFENMLYSFTLDKACLSKYLGNILSAKSMVDINEVKDLKMKKYDFETKLTKSWNIASNGFGFDYNNRYYSKFNSFRNEGMGFRGGMGNSEAINAMEFTSNMAVTLNAGLDTKEMKDIIKLRAEELLKNDEVRMGLAKIKIQSVEIDGAQLYYIEKEYDLNAIKDFVKEDAKKTYDLEALQNQYEYIIKIGKDTYTENITLPVANMTTTNKAKVRDIWNKTSINKKNYSKEKIGWKEHKLEEFDKEKI